MRQTKSERRPIHLKTIQNLTKNNFHASKLTRQSLSPNKINPQKNGTGLLQIESKLPAIAITNDSGIGSERKSSERRSKPGNKNESAPAKSPNHNSIVRGQNGKLNTIVFPDGIEGLRKAKSTTSSPYPSVRRSQFVNSHLASAIPSNRVTFHADLREFSPSLPETMAESITSLFTSTSSRISIKKHQKAKTFAEQFLDSKELNDISKPAAEINVEEIMAKAIKKVEAKRERCKNKYEQWDRALLQVSESAVPSLQVKIRRPNTHTPARHFKSEMEIQSKFFGSDKINDNDLAKYSAGKLQSVKKLISPVQIDHLPFFHELNEGFVPLTAKDGRRRSMFNESLIRLFHENIQKKVQQNERIHRVEKLFQQKLPEDYTRPAILKAAGNRGRRKGAWFDAIDLTEKKEDLEEKVVDPVDQMKDNERDKMLKISVLEIAAPTNPLELKGSKPLDEKLFSVLQKGTKKLKGYRTKNFKKIRQNLIEALHNLTRLGISSGDLAGGQKIFSKMPFEKKRSKDLIHAVKRGDFDAVEYLIKFNNRFLVYDFDFFHLTPLHWAIQRGDLNMTKFLMKYNADFEARDIIGRTPLYFALKYNHVEIVKLLLFNKADPWSSEDLNYFKLCTGKPLCRYYLKKSRQIHIMLSITKPSLRQKNWENHRTALISEPEVAVRLDPQLDLGMVEDH